MRLTEIYRRFCYAPRRFGDSSRGRIGDKHETQNLCQIYGVRSSDYANWTCGRGDCFTSFDRTER